MKGDIYMKLTKDQLSSLEKELISIETVTKQIMEELPRFDAGYSDFQLGDIMDASTLSNVHKLASRRKEIEQILECADIIKPTTNKVIQIGSSFEVDFGDGIEQFTLVETLNGITQYQSTVSVNCAFGKSVLGKQEQDSFSYPIPEGVMEGVITKIYAKRLSK